MADDVAMDDVSDDVVDVESTSIEATAADSCGEILENERLDFFGAGLNI